LRARKCGREANITGLDFAREKGFIGMNLITEEDRLSEKTTRGFFEKKKLFEERESFVGQRDFIRRKINFKFRLTKFSLGPVINSFS